MFSKCSEVVMSALHIKKDVAIQIFKVKKGFSVIGFMASRTVRAKFISMDRGKRSNLCLYIMCYCSYYCKRVM